MLSRYGAWFLKFQEEMWEHSSLKEGDRTLVLLFATGSQKENSGDIEVQEMCLLEVCFFLRRPLVSKVKPGGLRMAWVLWFHFQWFPGKMNLALHIYKKDLNFALFLTDRGLESSGHLV